MTAHAKLHIVFGPSAAGSLREALKISNRNETVLCPFDDFSFGPISVNKLSSRATWVDEVLGYSNWHEVVNETDEFLKKSCQDDFAPIAWVSFKETRSYSGFLWWLSQIGKSPLSLVNVPNLSLRSADELAKLLGCEEPLEADEIARRHRQWQTLQSENAALRVIDGDDLVSAPLTEFDELLKALGTPEWQRMAIIVGAALITFSDNGVYQTSDLVLASRLADLAEAEVFEWRGDLSQMRDCELRLPHIS